MASCGIRWVPNFETEGEEVYFEAMADASLSNTKSFARNFLAAIAENRAFVRCVRNFLRINVVGSDEMGDANLFTESNTNASAPAAADPHSLLSSVMKEKSVSFEDLNKKLIGEGKIEEGAWSSVQDIPKSQIFALIKRLKTRKVLNRYDKFKINFYKKVQQGYIKLSKKNNKYMIINSNNKINENKKIIINKIKKLLSL